MWAYRVSVLKIARRLAAIVGWLVVLYVGTVFAILMALMPPSVQKGLKISMKKGLASTNCESYFWKKKQGSLFNVVDTLWNFEYWSTNFRVHQGILQSPNCLSLMAKVAEENSRLAPITIVVVNDGSDVFMKFKFFSKGN